MIVKGLKLRNTCTQQVFSEAQVSGPYQRKDLSKLWHCEALCSK